MITTLTRATDPRTSTPDTAQAAKRARCSVEIATLYERKEGKPGSDAGAILPTGQDRRRLIRETVRTLFGSRTQQTPAEAAA